MPDDASTTRLVKKYSNRRLYDTVESRYVSLDELAASVRRGVAVRVLDAKTDEDLTRATLTAMLFETRGAAGYLTVPLLAKLMAMSDEALADFLGGYLEAAQAMYAQAREGAHADEPPRRSELGEIRRELDELKRVVARGTRRVRARTKR